MLWQLATRATADISVLHERAPLFVRLQDGSMRNAYTMRLLNKRPETRPFASRSPARPGHHRGRRRLGHGDFRPVVAVGPDSSREIRVLVTVPHDTPLEQSQIVTFTASDLFAGEVVRTQDHFIAP